MKRLGQHFLKNKNILKRIAEDVEAQSGEVIVEIGPGHGELSKFLLGAYPENQFILIERDTKLVEQLLAKSSPSAAIFSDQNIKITNGDVLKVLPDVVAGLNGRPYRLVGNLPYYITGYLFRIIEGLAHKPAAAVFLVQKEVAERLVSLPPTMNRFAASVQFWADVSIAAVVHKEDFRPQPRVESAVVKVVPHSRYAEADSVLYYKTVATLFRHPRKTILNNLSETPEAAVSKGELMHTLQNAGFDPRLRPQNLQVADIIRISKQIQA